MTDEGSTWTFLLTSTSCSGDAAGLLRDHGPTRHLDQLGIRALQFIPRNIQVLLQCLRQLEIYEQLLLWQFDIRHASTVNKNSGLDEQYQQYLSNYRNKS
ncbi:hypothetical protein V2G26_000376 [Clonostachys chloroleuca]